jgi:hypothetical protein
MSCKRLESHHGGGVGDDFVDGLLNPNVAGCSGGNDDNDTTQF